MSMSMPQPHPYHYVVALLYYTNVHTPTRLYVPYAFNQPLTPNGLHAALSYHFPSLLPASEIYALPLARPIDGFRAIVAGPPSLFTLLEETHDTHVSSQHQGSVDLAEFKQRLESIESARLVDQTEFKQRLASIESARLVDQTELNQRLANIESARLVDQTELFNFKKRYIIDQEQVILYSIRRLVCLCLESKVPALRVHTGPHSAIKQLEVAASTGPAGFQPLMASSALAARFFTPQAVSILNQAINSEDRHCLAHLELTPIKLLSDTFFLEFVRRLDWSGNPWDCPASVALRLLLLVLGPERARDYRSQIVNDSQGVFFPLNREQQDRLEIFFQ